MALYILIGTFSLAFATLNVGHRGNGCSHPQCSNTFPENSIPSFLKGIENGADVVELDTWISADDVIMVTHRDKPTGDDHLYPVIIPEAPGKSTPTVKNFKFSEREKYKVKMPWIIQKPEYSHYLSDAYTVPYEPTLYIPTLEEVFAKVCPTGKQIVVELKGDNPKLAPMVLALAEKMKVVNCIHTFSTFYWKSHQHKLTVPADLFEPIKSDNRLKKALLFFSPPDDYEELFKAAKYYNASFFHPAASVVPTMKARGFLTRCKQEGIKVFSWFGGSGNETELQLRDAVNQGVDEVCTNNPDVLHHILPKTFDLPNDGLIKKSQFQSLLP